MHMNLLPPDSSAATGKDLAQMEYLSLREELHNLKNCQVTFLTYSVTGTGLLLGILGRPGLSTESSLLLLLPLTILLPFWWVFFDKAKTITRIVGYYRLLEKHMLSVGLDIDFIGWENGLAKFREWQQKGRLKIPDDQTPRRGVRAIFDALFIRTAHPYWILVYAFFFGLSGLCLLLALALPSQKGLGFWLILVAAGLLFLLSAVVNGRWVCRLIWGRNSFNVNECFWVQVLTRDAPRS